MLEIRCWPKDSQSVHHNSIVYIDEEGHALLSAQGCYIHLLKLSCCIDVRLEYRVLLESLIVECLAICCQVLVIQSENDLAQAFRYL